MHLGRRLNSWSLRCSWSIACRRCSNYIFIPDLTSSPNELGKDNCKTRRESFMSWDLVHLILETLRYLSKTGNEMLLLLFHRTPWVWSSEMSLPHKIHHDSIWKPWYFFFNGVTVLNSTAGGLTALRSITKRRTWPFWYLIYLCSQHAQALTLPGTEKNILKSWF